MSSHPSLGRRLGTPDPAVIGLGTMIGAGVLQRHVVGAAGRAVPDLGRHIRVRARTPRPLAGWGFLVGNTASAAANGLTFAA